MDRDQDHFQEDNDFQNILGRFERMHVHEKSSFFDVFEFERIIDHYLDKNLFSKAMDAVTRGIRQHPGSVTLMIKEAQVYAEKGESQKALEMVKSIEILEHSNNEVYMLKGMILNQMGRIGEAGRAFDRAIELTHENKVDVLYDIALSFEYVNRYKLAVRYLDMARRKRSDKPDILYELAHCYDRLHDFERSIECYEAYLDLEPYSEHVWYNLGMLYFKKENFRKAVECYDFAIAIKGDYAAAVFNRANALSNLEEYPEAILAYRECILLEPENVLAQCYLGEALEKMESYEEAIEWYQKAARIDPSFSEAWYGIAVCYLLLKRYNDALYYVNKAIELDDENPDFWFTLGNVYIHLDSCADAMKAYVRTTELDPYDDEAWINRARLEFKQGHTEKAIQVLRKAYRYVSEISPVNYYLSAYCYLSGNLSEALKFFEQGLRIAYADHVITGKICPDLFANKSFRELLNKYKPL